MINSKRKNQINATITVFLALMITILHVPSSAPSSSLSNDLLAWTKIINPYAHVQGQEVKGQNVATVSMVEGAADPNSEQFFIPKVINMKSDDTVK